MNFADYVLIAVIAAVLIFAALYVYKSRKSGRKCIGCPGGGCASREGAGCDGCCSGCSCGK